MKKIKCLSLIIAIVFLSCSRDRNSLNQQGDPEISFDIDGIHYVHKGQPTMANGGYGASGFKQLGVPNVQGNVYTFSGNTDQANLISLAIDTETDTLKIRDYKNTENGSSNPNPDRVTIEMRAGNKVYGLAQNGDFIDIKINGYGSAIVNGTFSGTITRFVSLNPLVTESALLTNGVIKNVKIIY